MLVRHERVRAKGRPEDRETREGEREREGETQKQIIEK